MGAWGGQAFQNDAALDWLSVLEAGGVAELRGLLARVADSESDDYVDVDDGSAVIAAAEIVAATLPFGQDRLTNEGKSWLDANATDLGPEDLALARRAVERVLAGESELRALWDANGPESEWHADVRVLLVRLGGDVDLVGPPVVEAATHEESVDEGSKQMLLTFLMMRGLPVSEAQRARIWSARDREEIRRWLARVVDTTSVAALLDE
jgi:hypothetical protein